MFKYDSRVMRFLGDATDYIILNILFIVFSLPVFTFGAANTARYYVAMKAARGHDVYVWKDFTNAFISNFKKATAVWLIVFLVDIVVAYNWFLIYANRNAGFSQIYVYVLLVVSVLILLVELMLFPFIARFDNTVFNTIKLSCGITLINIFKMIFVLFLEVLPFLTSYRYMQWAFLIIPVGTAAVLYINGYLFANMFRKLENASEEGEDGNSVKQDEDEVEKPTKNYNEIIKRMKNITKKDDED